MRWWTPGGRRRGRSRSGSGGRRFSRVGRRWRLRKRSSIRGWWLARGCGWSDARQLRRSRYPMLRQQQLQRRRLLRLRDLHDRRWRLRGPGQRHLQQRGVWNLWRPGPALLHLRQQQRVHGPKYEVQCRDLRKVRRSGRALLYQQHRCGRVQQRQCHLQQQLLRGLRHPRYPVLPGQPVPSRGVLL
jgi:hypothetical protein